MGRLPEVVAAGAVTLRRRRVEDVAQIVEAMRASWTELRKWFSWAQAEPDVDALRHLAAAGSEDFDDGRDYEFVIVGEATGVVVGAIRVNPLAEPAGAEIGYWVRTDRTGRG